MPRIKYQDIKLRAASLQLVDTCNTIITEYQAAGFVLTLRQLYYQLVSRDIIANKQSEYKRVGAIINDARLAGLIDWNAMEDRTRNVQSISHWSTPADIINSAAHSFRLDKWATQSVRPEVWIEKDALVGVIAGVCSELDVSYFSCRGYTSQSEMWGAAQRFIRHFKASGQDTHIVHLGDHDPSGQDMSRDIEDRINMFMSYHIGPGHFTFKRIALNMDQVRQYEPPPNPAKSSDTRFEGYRAEHGDESWELDALEPTVLAALIREEVEQLKDDDAYQKLEDEESDHRDNLTKAADNWSDVEGYLAEL
jgi:hypothetical protein